MSDLTLKTDGGIVNIRVGAIIMKEGKFLMVCNNNEDYMYTVGGRIQFGETIENAVVREVYEETGVKMEIDRLGFIHENFFVADSWAKSHSVVHEYSFIFYMKTPDNFKVGQSDCTEDGYQQKLVWVSPDDDAKYYPQFFKTELRNPSKYVKHFVTDDR